MSRENVELVRAAYAMGSILEGDVKQKIDSAFADYLDDRQAGHHAGVPGQTRQADVLDNFAAASGPPPSRRPGSEARAHLRPALDVRLRRPRRWRERVRKLTRIMGT